jgi:hypothetical protein
VRACSSRDPFTATSHVAVAVHVNDHVNDDDYDHERVNDLRRPRRG